MMTLYTAQLKSAMARRGPVLRRQPRIFARQSGQSLLEVALMLPFLLLLLIGVIEMGRYAYISILIGNAARAGAAYGVQSNAQSVDTLGIKNAAVNDFMGNGQGSTLTVTSSVTCGCDSSGTVTTAGCSSITNPTAGTCAAGHWVVILTVTASSTFNSLFSYPGIPSSMAMSRSSTMRVNENG
jgi:Flp pilus assembly protein TadG